MLLFENYLAGNPVIKLEFEEFRGYEVDPIHIHLESLSRI